VKLLQSHLIMGSLLTLTTGVVIIRTMDWSATLPTMALAAFVAWLMVPLVLALAAGWFMRRSKPALASCSLGLWVAFGLMASQYAYVFHLNPDPQGGLILIFGPLYALVAMVPCALAALYFFFRKPKSEALPVCVAQ